MTSAVYVSRFRRAVGDPGGDEPLFETDEIDDLFLQADEDYENASDNAKLAYAVVLGLESLLVMYATQVNYTANSVSENLGTVFDHYQKLLKQWQDKFDAAMADNTPMVMWGSTSVSPRRDAEYPDA